MSNKKTKKSPWLLCHVGLDEESAEKLLQVEIEKPAWWVDGAMYCLMNDKTHKSIEKLLAQDSGCQCQAHKDLRYIKHQDKVEVVVVSSSTFPRPGLIFLAVKGELLSHIDLFKEWGQQ
ncbi:MAG: hypothetical protein GY938_24520 [Ketobacter sp.]|nr:hypothetical protein [Ketobacter sp.]